MPFLFFIFGYYILEDNNEDIIDFCYRPRSSFFNIDDAVIRRNTGLLVENTTGYCDSTNATDYTGNRNTAMTQVMIKNVSATAGGDNFEHMSLGTDSNEKIAKTFTFDIYATSVLPAYGNAKDSKIKECFEKNASDKDDGVVKCMTDNNIPNKMLVEQVNLANIQNSELCDYFGSGGRTASTNTLCRDI